MTLRKPRTDAFVAAVENRQAPLMPPQGKTAQIRRSNAEAFDVVMTTELGIAPIDVATEEHTVPVAGHPDARLRVNWPTPERPNRATEGGRGYVPAADHLHRDIVSTLRALKDQPITYPEVTPQ